MSKRQVKLGFWLRVIIPGPVMTASLRDTTPSFRTEARKTYLKSTQ